jgi:hypothetical protein
MAKNKMQECTAEAVILLLMKDFTFCLMHYEELLSNSHCMCLLSFALNISSLPRLFFNWLRRQGRKLFFWGGGKLLMVTPGLDKISLKDVRL